jgi:hypothetical protein
MEGRRVDHDSGTQGLEHATHPVRTGDIELGVEERKNLIPGKGFDQVSAELSVGADNGDPHSSPPEKKGQGRILGLLTT